MERSPRKGEQPSGHAPVVATIDQTRRASSTVERSPRKGEQPSGHAPVAATID
ncbi:hypothetical protein [Janthinobacterium sp.]|uniref:hypothetical protein n=1 Tax=Janthinobacterium sp. TaxID=1871054 RepID=UPI0025B9735D|nr:hypothetical protein [Janthinobacterium sp.]